MATDRNIRSWFEQRARDDGRTFIALAENAPDWLRDAVREAHDGELPNDWRYAVCADIVHVLDESDDPSAEGDFEYADCAVDVYTRDLLAWYADNVTRTSYADDSVDEFGAADSLADLLARGQAFCLAQMFATIAAAYMENVVNVDA